MRFFDLIFLREILIQGGRQHFHKMFEERDETMALEMLSTTFSKVFPESIGESGVDKLLPPSNNQRSI